MIKKAVKTSLSVIYNPDREFKNLQTRTFETITAEYMTLLVTSSILSGIADFAYNSARIAYLNFRYLIDINFHNAINYAIGISIAKIFLFMFLGTVGLFVISLGIKPFMRNLKYTNLLSVMMYSAAPILIFGWLPLPPIPFILWSTFLFIKGILLQKNKTVAKDSIENRE